MTSAVKFRGLRRAILFFAILAPIWTIAVWRESIPLALAPLFFSHLLLLYPTLTPLSQWWGPVICSFATNQREVWITIDDGPSLAHTEKVLDLLDRHAARATFFVIGARAAAAPELLEQIRARGHQIANHTYSHPSARFWCALPNETAAQLDRCAAVIGEERAPYFRAPAGLKNGFIHPALARRNLSLVGWTARGFDTRGRSPQRVAARILRLVRPGAIVLLHEGHRVVEEPGYNLACIELTLRRLAEEGYSFVIPRPEQLRTGAGGT